MENTIRILSIEEGKRVYDNRMTKDFPACELKPWNRMEGLVKAGKYEMLGMFQKEELLAYGCFSRMEQGSYLLMDYFAVSEERRGGGIGQQFLSHINEQYPKAQGIIVEVEALEQAQTEEEQKIRARRIRFYEKTGLRLYPVFGRIYEADYQLMFLPGSEGFPTSAQLIEIYIKLYQVLLGEEKMKKHMKITKKS